MRLIYTFIFTLLFHEVYCIDIISGINYILKTIKDLLRSIIRSRIPESCPEFLKSTIVECILLPIPEEVPGLPGMDSLFGMIKWLITLPINIVLDKMNITGVVMPDIFNMTILPEFPSLNLSNFKEKFMNMIPDLPDFLKNLNITKMVTDIIKGEEPKQEEEVGRLICYHCHSTDHPTYCLTHVMGSSNTCYSPSKCFITTTQGNFYFHIVLS